ncbi:MAG: S46 family peptidase [Bacteroidales bacterium]|nr:S46 family peptidase [Bacteroidales bacterium]
MKNSLYVLAFLMLGAFGKMHADEGMWLPMFVDRLNYVDMQKEGLQLTAEEIYSINQSSLKDAIVGLSDGPKPNGYFCTAEVVSDQGLLFTNHHCGFDKIQNHSTLEHDYLTNGFWAMNKSEELPNEGLSVSFLVRMEDVTDSCLKVVSDTMTAEERSSAIRNVTTRLKKAASQEDRYHVVVKSFFEGNEYYMFVYEVFTDIRLVGAPPSAIGKFGGDTDNWMWPRHTGDFSIFRVYTSPDGKPADYSAENVPMKPRHHLAISLDGVKPGDFSMVWGYPGSTDRYLTSAGVDFNLEDEYPAIIELFGKKLEVWKEFMDTDQNVKIQYASKYASVANTWKYLIGQTRGLNRLGVSEKKRDQEKQFTDWVNADENRAKKYGNVLPDMAKGYAQMGESIAPLLYTSMAGSGGAEIIGFASDYSDLEAAMSPIAKKDMPKDKESAKKMKDEKKAELEKTIQSLKESLTEQYKEYSAIADQKVLAELLAIYAKKVDPAMQVDEIKEINKKYKGDFNAYAKDVFTTSIFTSEARVSAFLEKPNLKTLKNDPAFVLSNAFMAKMMEVSGGYRAAAGSLNTAKRLYVAGLREMQPNKVFYPDANSTMRMSYGTVQDYKAADAVQYNYITTMNGIIEKEDPTNDEFIVPAKLMDLIEKRDFGPYGVDNELIVCFLSTNDITGGNSGSPVINGKGELIGLAFDGNWEAMSGDIAYEPALQRTINVDIRYVLFIIDKYAGATNLIDELTIHKAMPEPKRVEIVAQ